jgi:hypothetical protein
VISRRQKSRKITPNGQRSLSTDNKYPEKRGFKPKNGFLDVCVGKPTDFNSLPMVRHVASTSY